ncbi:MAG: hypothetical protein LBT27_02440 [Prevotellaceae bacterium]|jgi:hypothetical protein|nr:hypothetical protein [Prevotellaceae bacterium]
MKKQFEISAYGVEEISQKELLEVDGGSVVGVVLLIILGIGILVGMAALSEYLRDNYYLEYQGVNSQGVHQYELKKLLQVQTNFIP